MLEIEYYGGNSLKINTKNSSLVVDPRRSVFGAKDLKVDQSVELITELELGLNSSDAILNIDSSGEYEVGDFSVKGFAINRHTDFNDEKSVTNYVVEVNDVSVGIIGNCTDKVDEDHLENLGAIDVLIIPVGGGGYTLDGKMAANLVSSIEPKVIIPVHYKDGNDYPVPQDDLKEFLSAMGKTARQEDKLKIKNRSQILNEELEIIQLKVQK